MVQQNYFQIGIQQNFRSAKSFRVKTRIIHRLTVVDVRGAD